MPTCLMGAVFFETQCKTLLHLLNTTLQLLKIVLKLGKQISCKIYCNRMAYF